MVQAPKVESLRILAIDIGGTHVKVKCNTGDEVRRVESGAVMTADRFVAAVKEMTRDWQFDVISMGYPGTVLHDKIVREPRNLGPGWVKFDFEQAFGKPVKIGGLTVHPGDLIHADQHGVVTIPHEIAAEVAARAREVEDKERVIINFFRSPDFSPDKVIDVEH